MANEIEQMLQGVGLGHSLDTANHCVEYGITWEITSLEVWGFLANQGKVNNDGSIIIDKNEIDSITFDTTINEGKNLVDEKPTVLKKME